MKKQVKRAISISLTPFMLQGSFITSIFAVEQPPLDDNTPDIAVVNLQESGTMTLTTPSDVNVTLYNTFNYRLFDADHKVEATSTSKSDGTTSYIFENLPVGNCNYPIL